METLTKEFFVEKLDSLHQETSSIRSDINSLHQETSSIRGNIESLAEITSKAFTGMTNRFVTLETKVGEIDTKVDTLIRFDHQHQIDVLRDDMRVVKTKLGIA